MYQVTTFFFYFPKTVVKNVPISVLILDCDPIKCSVCNNCIMFVAYSNKFKHYLEPHPLLSRGRKVISSDETSECLYI